MEKNLVKLIKELNKKLEKIPGKNGKKIRYVKELNELAALYSNLEIPKDYLERYNDLIVRATELNEGENYRNIKKIEKFLPLCFYLYYEINGEVKQIMNRLSYSFIITCILFLFISFPIFPPLLTILFIVPMFLGVRGLSKGQLRSMVVGMTVIEFSLLAGLIALSFVVASIPKYGLFIKGLIEEYGKGGVHITTTTMNILVVVYALMAVCLICSAYINIKGYRKYKKIFI